MSNTEASARNEWEAYIKNGGLIFSKDGTAVNADALVGAKPVERPAVAMPQQKARVVSKNQLRALGVEGIKSNG